MLEDEEAATWGKGTARWRGPIALVPAVQRDKLDVFLCLVLKLFRKRTSQMRLLGVIGEEVVGETDVLYRADASSLVARPNGSLQMTERWLHKPDIDITGNDWLKRERGELGPRSLAMAGPTHVKYS